MRPMIVRAKLSLDVEKQAAYTAENDAFERIIESLVSAIRRSISK